VRKVFVAIGIVVVALTAGVGASQASNTCVYTNDTVWNGAPNTVDGYYISDTLAATYISPVLTGGTSYQGADYQHLVSNIVLSPTKNILYASDDLSNDIAAMKIDGSTCQLTLIGNYPVGGGNRFGIGLAITPDGQWLYAVSTHSNILQVLAVHDDGSLGHSKQDVTLPSSPSGMAVSPDGSTLIVALTNIGAMLSYSIDPSSGMITQVTELERKRVGPMAISIDSQSKFVYAGDANTVDEIGVYEIGPESTLTARHVFIENGDDNGGSMGVILSPDGHFLYVTNQYGGMLTTLRVNSSNGQLSFVESVNDLPPGGGAPAGLATTSSGAFVFTGQFLAEGGGYLGFFEAMPDGSLTSLGPLFVAQQDDAAYPASVVAREFF
jgi:6-phosphogluconolactonase (cycloisomerase 2 family)